MFYFNDRPVSHVEKESQLSYSDRDSELDSFVFLYGSRTDSFDASCYEGEKTKICCFTLEFKTLDKKSLKRFLRAKDRHFSEAFVGIYASQQNRILNSFIMLLEEYAQIAKDLRHSCFRRYL